MIESREWTTNEALCRSFGVICKMMRDGVVNDVTLFKPNRQSMTSLNEVDVAMEETIAPWWRPVESDVIQ